MSNTSNSNRLFHVQGPRGHWLLGEYKRVRTDVLSFLQQVAYEYGPVAKFYLGPLPVYLVSGPEASYHVLHRNQTNYVLNRTAMRVARRILGNSLVTADADEWLRSRQTCQKAVNWRLTDRVCELTTFRMTEQCRQWQQAALNNREVDLDADFRKTALRIAGEVLLGAKLEDHTNAISSGVAEVSEYFARRLESVIRLPMWVPTPGNRRINATLKIVPNLVDEIIQQRVADQSQDRPYDLLDALLDYRDPKTKQPMSFERIRNEAVGMLTAGHETSTNAIIWTLHLLVHNPQILAAVRAELDRELGDLIPTKNDLPRCKLMFRVVSESLRLFPPTWTMSRTAKQTDVVDGYLIPKGASILISQYVTHRHKGYWTNPDHFDPDRFLEDAVDQQVPHAYYPFGMGPRVCIGRYVAMAQIQIMLMSFLKQFSLTGVTPDHMLPQASFSLRVAGGLRARLVQS